MYLPELSILNILLKKVYFNQYYYLIDLKYIKENYKELFYLYETLSSLHAAVEHDLSLPELQVFFFSTYPESDKDAYLDLFNRLQEASISEDVGEVLLKDIKRRKEALKLSERLFNLSQGKKLEDGWDNELKDFLEDKDDHKGSEVKRVTLSLDDLLDGCYQKSGLRWRLQCLNKSLGSLRPGDFGFIFARPETGKTTFLASEITHMLDGAQRPIIWFNNEEQGEKVMLRVYQAYFGVGIDVINANRKKFETAFISKFGDLFQMYDQAALHWKQIESVLQKEEPALVVYDQLTKIKGFKADRPDLVLGEIFQWAREEAKGRHAAIGVSQADGTAEGVRYLTMEHVANAKTAVQAEADWILGIGKTHDTAFEKVRYLNISKNKLFGDEDSLPQLKHGRFDVLINPAIARYEDTITYS